MGAGWEPDARTKVTLHLLPLSKPHPEEPKLPGLTFPTALRSCAANKRAGMSTETRRLLFPAPQDPSAWSRGARRYPGGKVLSSPHHSPKKVYFRIVYVSVLTGGIIFILLSPDVLRPPFCSCQNLSRHPCRRQGGAKVFVRHQELATKEPTAAQEQTRPRRFRQEDREFRCITLPLYPTLWKIFLLFKPLHSIREAAQLRKMNKQDLSRLCTSVSPPVRNLKHC